jgi:hypothetical protein
MDKKGIIRLKWLRFIVAAVGFTLTSNCIAQLLSFPPAPTNPVIADIEFDTRAKAVIALNACSHEDDYHRIRSEMAAGNF